MTEKLQIEILKTQETKEEKKDQKEEKIATGSCNICLEDLEVFIPYCKCKGSNGNHKECLKQWIKTSYRTKCRVCDSYYSKELLISIDDTYDENSDTSEDETEFYDFYTLFTRDNNASANLRICIVIFSFFMFYVYYVTKRLLNFEPDS
jgi:hypothetical protein